MEKKNNNLSFPRNVVGNLPLSKLFMKEDKQLCFNEKVEDPRQKHSGMTALFDDNIKAFTLIELLVVVLIIGILAAVAVPQYQRAVDKSRFSNMMAITRAIADANEVYYLANGSYATNFDELSVSIPAKSFSGRSAFFDWGRCTLYGQRLAMCTNSVQLKNQYMVGYNYSDMSVYAGKGLCTALTATRGSRWDKVCASVGTFRHQATCELEGIQTSDGSTCQVYVVVGK